MKYLIVHAYEDRNKGVIDRSEIYELRSWIQAGKQAHLIEMCGCPVLRIETVDDSEEPTNKYGAANIEDDDDDDWEPSFINEEAEELVPA